MRASFAHRGMPRRRARRCAPGPAIITCGVWSITARARTMGFFTRVTAATAPAVMRGGAPNARGSIAMIDASISTVPMVVRTEPVPALKRGLFSSSTTTACTASRAAPPSRRIRAPARTAAIRAMRRSGRSIRAPRAPAPPWAIRAGAVLRISRDGAPRPEEQTPKGENHRTRRAVCALEALAVSIEKVRAAILGERVDERSKPGGPVPIHHLRRRAHGMLEGVVMAIHFGKSDLGQHLAILLRRRDFAKRALDSRQKRAPWLFAREAVHLHLCGLVVIGRHLNNHPSAGGKSAKPSLEHGAMTGDPLEGGVREDDGVRGGGIEHRNIPFVERNPRPQFGIKIVEPRPGGIDHRRRGINSSNRAATGATGKFDRVLAAAASEVGDSFVI